MESSITRRGTNGTKLWEKLGCLVTVDSLVGRVRKGKARHKGERRREREKRERERDRKINDIYILNL